MFYKCKVKKALGKMALWLLPKRGLLRVGAKANVPLCGGKKMNKKCAVGKKKKYRRVSKECRLTRCPVSIWSVFVCLSVKMVYFSCPSVRYCQVARSSVTLAANGPRISAGRLTDLPERRTICNITTIFVRTKNHRLELMRC
jgi:hypothetical protein